MAGIRKISAIGLFATCLVSWASMSADAAYPRPTPRGYPQPMAQRMPWGPPAGAYHPGPGYYPRAYHPRPDHYGPHVGRPIPTLRVALPPVVIYPQPLGMDVEPASETTDPSWEGNISSGDAVISPESSS
jgi:hypothetical protein